MKTGYKSTSLGFPYQSGPIHFSLGFKPRAFERKGAHKFTKLRLLFSAKHQFFNFFIHREVFFVECIVIIIAAVAVAVAVVVVTVVVVIVVVITLWIDPREGES